MSSIRGGFQLGAQGRCLEIMFKVFPPFICQVQLTLVALLCSGGVSSWISPSSEDTLPPFLSLFHFLSNVLV